MTAQDGLYRSIVTARMWLLELMEMMQMDQAQGMYVSTLGTALVGIK